MRPVLRGRCEYRRRPRAGSTRIGARLTAAGRAGKVPRVTDPTTSAGPTPTHACRALAPGAARARLADAIVLDVREENAFARGHLAGAARLAPAEFGERRAELPPRTACVLVVHDEPAAARAAAETLAALEYRDVAWLDAALAEFPGGHTDLGPAARAWRPSPFVERMRPHLAPGRALDLAAGSGRESVFLAMHGWQVEAWDHDPVALARASALAARHGVELSTRVVELETADAGPGTWDAIVVCRFLHRPLFPWIERALAPGGTLVYETFRRGQEVHGRPKQPRFLLEPGELTASFPLLRVECYEEHEPEGGPVMARVLARRPGAGPRERAAPAAPDGISAPSA